MTHDTDNAAIWHGTTILAVRKGRKLVMLSDGQVSMGQTIMKGNARKVRRIAGGDILAGFAGATADAFTLFERLEAKLASSNAPPLNLPRIGGPRNIFRNSKPC